MHPAVALGRPAACVEGSGRADLAGEDRQAVERRDPRRVADGPRAAPAREARRRPHVRARSSEIIVGSAIAKGFSGTQRRQPAFRAARLDHRRHLFDAGGSGFDSEIWGDVDQLMQSFRRTSYSSMVLRIAPTASRVSRPTSTSTRASPTRRNANRPSTVEGAVDVHQHPRHHAVDDLLDRRDDRRDDHDASVANRVAEIGTLRALGFKRTNVLAAFLLEALLLGFVGGVAAACASLMQVRVVLDDQLSNLRRPVVSLRADARDRREDAAVLAGDEPSAGSCRRCGPRG